MMKKEYLRDFKNDDCFKHDGKAYKVVCPFGSDGLYDGTEKLVALSSAVVYAIQIGDRTTMYKFDPKVQKEILVFNDKRDKTVKVV